MGSFFTIQNVIYTKHPRALAKYLFTQTSQLPKAILDTSVTRKRKKEKKKKTQQLLHTFLNFSLYKPVYTSFSKTGSSQDSRVHFAYQCVTNINGHKLQTNKKYFAQLPASAEFMAVFFFFKSV